MVQYDIDSLISSYIGKSPIDLIEDLSRRISAMEQIKNVDKHVEMVGSSKDVFMMYYRFCQDLLSYIYDGIAPSGLNLRHDFLKVKPIIESFVMNGQWRKESLNAFQ